MKHALSTRPRILLAEDNEINQKVAMRMLAKIGYEADHVDNGIDAIAALKRRRYDIVLMDLHMPVMSGLEATVDIRANRTIVQPVIVALTASATAWDREACLEAGMNAYLSKPIDIDLLRQTIEAHTPAAPQD